MPDAGLCHAAGHRPLPLFCLFAEDVGLRPSVRNDVDPEGNWFAFEKGAEKVSCGDGYADVWKRGFFACEYKGEKKDLRAAYPRCSDDSQTRRRPSPLPSRTGRR